MNDLCSRLRDLAAFSDGWDEAFDGDLIREAADEIERLRAALAVIADKDRWAEKYPMGAYQCIAVEAIGIARDALRSADVAPVVLHGRCVHGAHVGEGPCPWCSTTTGDDGVR